jgi:hypothetical protein
MPQAKKEDPKPPPPEVWDHAQRLTPVASTREPALISDGGGLPFAPEAAFGPVAPLDPEDPPVAALIVQIDRGRRLAQPDRPFRRKARLPPMQPAEQLAGWRVLARSEDEILYGRGRPPHLLTVAVKRGRRDRWAPLGASNSRPLRATRDRTRASSWRLDPTYELTPEQTELRVLLTEQTMATGSLADDRLLAPDLYLDDDQLVLRFYVRPLEGYVGRTARRETPVVVKLPEPLGNRRVLDGAVYGPPVA